MFKNFLTKFVLSLVTLVTACGGGGTSSVGNNSWIGTKQLGAAGIDTEGKSLATDASGNVYVVGFTDGGIDGNIKQGSYDFFLTKYDISGKKLFTKQSGVAGALALAYDVAIDAAGNVYVAGYTNGGLDGNTLSGTQDLFLTKYSSSGVKLFTKLMGAAGSMTQAFSISIDASGNVYVVGTTTGGLDGNARTGTEDFFVTKFNSSGAKQFTKQMGVVGGVTFGQSVATDASGNVYVSGITSGGLDGNTLTGDQDLFVIKYDSSGAKQFTKQMGTAGIRTITHSVATDNSGNVYVTGNTSGGLDGNTLTGLSDFFVVKYDGNGTKQFTKQVGVAGRFTEGWSVATDVSGNVYVAGNTTGGLDGNTRAGIKDLYVTKFNSSGVKQFTKQMGVVGRTTDANKVITDANGNIFLTGYTDGNLDGNTVAGVADLFVVKYNNSGVKQ